MDIRQLKYFVAIVDCGSFSKAAEALCIAQPSLSQQLANLESELKTQLLIRSHQGVRPSQAGSNLYLRARDILRQMSELPMALQMEGMESGRVAVGLPTSVAVVFAYPLFERVRREYPGIQLHIVEGMSGYLVELMANGRLDMAILFRDSETRGVAVDPLCDEALFAFGDIPGVGPSEPVTMRQISGMPVVLPGPANGLRILVERALARESLELNVVADIDSLKTMLAIARQRKNITINSPAAFGRRAEDKPLIHRIVDQEIQRPVGLCSPTALPESAAALAVRKIVKTLSRELIDDGRWLVIGSPYTR